MRRRAGLATQTSVMPGMTHDQFLAQLKYEGIIGLFGERHRWDDLSRWGDLDSNLATRDAGLKTLSMVEMSCCRSRRINWIPIQL